MTQIKLSLNGLTEKNATKWIIYGFTKKAIDPLFLEKRYYYSAIIGAPDRLYFTYWHGTSNISAPLKNC